MTARTFTRRDAGLMFLAATGALAATPFGRARAQALEGTQVIVIGAGIAGLGAARSLKNQGAEVIVLEGKPHIGGRLLTDWSMGAPFEVGAGWIHGPEQANPSRQLADAVGAEYVVTDDENAVYFHANGDEFGEDDYEEMSDGWESVVEHIDETFERNDPRSLLKAIRAYDSDLLDDPRVMWAFSAWTEFSKGGPIEDLSAILFNADKAFDTPDVVVTTGYDKILGPLAVDLDIRLSHTVTEVSYEKGDGVAVETDKGTFEADYCICTVPLGVLKAEKIAFDPPLPQRYRQSIDRLGFGSVTKLALKFDEPFWDVETQYFGIVTEPKGRWNYWLNYRTFSDENILLGLSVGAYAPVADKMTDAEMTEDGLDVLRQVWGDDVGTPTQVLATHWATDPYSLGAYAYPRPGNSRSDYDGLARAVEDCLFLAGEHTIFDYAGTTHGAYMSGLRAAEAVIEAES
ncbi:flavin monoamine oxidase family protein [Hwanghaeella sp.]|uniref:flavin monoamine oxidase family protein n=1 Tax=Hwanghaeella sp. TaxID=2605943 RepID=UPI003CCB9A4E